MSLIENRDKKSTVKSYNDITIYHDLQKLNQMNIPVFETSHSQTLVRQLFLQPRHSTVSNATPFLFSADVILDNAHLTKTQKCTHPARRTILKPL